MKVRSVLQIALIFPRKILFLPIPEVILDLRALYRGKRSRSGSLGLDGSMFHESQYGTVKMSIHDRQDPRCGIFFSDDILIHFFRKLNAIAFIFLYILPL